MISKLKGLLDEKDVGSIVIDVGGVCYHVACSLETLRHLPAVGAACSVYTDMIVREDLMQLYGFYTAAERDWFRLLLTVQGVGMKASLALLSIGDPGYLRRAITSGDPAYLARADGVGPKLAARVINELKDKVAMMPGPQSGPVQEDHENASPSSTVVPIHRGSGGGGGQLPSSIATMATSALLNLGYRQMDAERAVEDVLATDPLHGGADHGKVEDVIRLALRRLG